MWVSGAVHGDELNGVEFPGSPRGSLGARLANLFLRTVVAHCDVGIDLHTAGGERVNVPEPASRASRRETDPH